MESKIKDEKCEQKDMYLYNIIFESVTNEGVSIDENIYKYIKQHKNIGKVDLDKPVLVFKYSMYNCTICMDFIWEKLNKAFNNNLNSVSQFLALPSDYNINAKGIIEQSINLGTKKLNIPIERGEIPFLF